MKELFAGILLILIIGIGGFFYRNEVEGNGLALGSNGNQGGACTQEAKICPDGSAVGRTGPGCTFAICPPPNVEIDQASTTLAFVLPVGYSEVQQGTSSPSSLRTYQKSITPGSFDTITISSYQIPTGENASGVMLAHTVFEPSGKEATTTNEFGTITEGSNSFSIVDIERFDGTVESLYYLATTSEVYQFDLVERNVTNWNDPTLNTDTLSEHKALEQMLATLQINES